MPNSSDSRDQVVAEVAALRRQVQTLKDVEQRCRQAESALQAFAERNRLLGDSTPLGIFTIDDQGWITGLNRKMREIFVWLSVEAPQSTNLFDCRPLPATQIVADIRRCIAQQQPVIADHPCIDHQDACLYLRYYLSPVSTDGGRITSVMAIVEDITDLKKTEEALRESEKRYRQLFQSAPIALIEWDVSRLKAHLDDLRVSGVVDFRDYLEGDPQQVHHCWSLIKTVDYNKAFLELMGVADTPPGPQDVFLPTDSSTFLRMAQEVILAAASGKTTEEREQTLVTSTGKLKTVLGKSLPVSGHENTLERVAIALVDISERKKAEEALRESERRFRDQSLRDSLTGLYNQRHLYQSLAYWIDRGRASDRPLSLIFMDLDHFKRIVDTHGHLNGSRAIQKVARTINNCLEEPAYAVAYAGDEFVVVLPGLDPSQALQKAYEIRSRMSDTVYELEPGIAVRLQASFGIATFPHHAEDINGLIAAADHALFSVKGSGKGAVAQFQAR